MTNVIHLAAIKLLKKKKFDCFMLFINRKFWSLDVCLVSRYLDLVQFCAWESLSARFSKPCGGVRDQTQALFWQRIVTALCIIPGPYFFKFNFICYYYNFIYLILLLFLIFSVLKKQPYLLLILN